MSNCSICTEKYNKSTRKVITCPYCNEESCQSCVRGYLMGLNSDKPKCMHCSKEWTLEFICDATPKVFHNKEYRDHRVKIYMESEEALLPATQGLVDQVKNERNRYQRIDNLKKQEKELVTALKVIRTKIRELRYENSMIGEQEESKAPVRIMCPCPKNLCRGFVRGESKKCGICETRVCGKCHNVKDDNHVCNENDIESVNTIKRDSKPCPGCKIPIFKISGCSQMFCTSCHVKFDWRTGKEVSGQWFHNPHMVEWQRTQQNSTENTCINGLPRVAVLHNYLVERLINHKDVTRIISFHTLIHHINDMELVRYPMSGNIRDNADLRVRYLMNEISKKDWLFNLKKRQKKSEKDTDIHQMLEMFSHASTDIINNAMTQNDSTIIVNALEQLIEYTNTNMHKIKKRFSGKIPIIGVDGDHFTIRTV